MIEPGTVLTVMRVFTTHGMDIDFTTGLGGSAVGAFLSTLVLGAILMALAPAYTERLTDEFLGNFVGSFLYGLIFLFVLIVLIVILIVTIIGILFAIPLIIIAYLVWAFGSALGFLAIGQRLIDDDDWKVPLLVGALINGGLTLTGIGGLVSFAVGAAGFGTILNDWLK